MNKFSLLIFILIFFIITGCTDNDTVSKTKETKVNNEVSTHTQQKAPVDIEEKILNNTSWELSGTFQSGGYEMLGKPRKVGIIYEPFESGKTKKYMWHFWGNNLPSGKLTVLGVKEGTKKAKPVLELDGKLVWASRELGGSNNGADAHIPSNMHIDHSGKWKLFIFIGEKYIDNIVINVD